MNGLANDWVITQAGYPISVCTMAFDPDLRAINHMIADRVSAGMNLNTDLSGPGWVAVLSSAVTGIAAFLPWVTAGVQAGPVDVSASATGIEGMGLLTLLLAIVAIAVVLVRGLASQGAVATAILGAVIAVVGLWKFLDLGGAAEPGIGLYLTIIGGVGVLVGGLWAYQSGSERSARGHTT